MRPTRRRADPARAGSLQQSWPLDKISPAYCGCGHGARLHHFIYAVLCDLDEFAAQLVARIESICADTGAAQVTLIGHSMGGLVCRRLLTMHAHSRIAKLVTLGTPHHGSHYSRWLVGKNAQQMRIGSDWLASLALAEAPTQRPPTLCLYSHFDEIISPSESGILAWARNVPIAATGHYGLVFSEVAANEVIQFLSKVE